MVAIRNRTPAMAAAYRALEINDLRSAEIAARRILASDNPDVDAVILLGLIAMKLGLFRDAEPWLKEAIRRQPDHPDALAALTEVSFRQGRLDDALTWNSRYSSLWPNSDSAVQARGQLYAQTGDYVAAAGVYQAFLNQHPNHARSWLNLANVLKTLGKTEDAIAGYRRAIALQPPGCAAWWSLSNLKIFRFTRDEIERMEGLAATPGLGKTDRRYIHFALGKAFEDEGDFERSFRHYDAGNDIAKSVSAYRAAVVSDEVDRCIAMFNRQFFAERSGFGSSARDPIFIIGMPRAGSTLIEQILSSHPAIEGTSELPCIPLTIQDATAIDWQTPRSTTETMATLGEAQVATLAEAYLNRASMYRKSSRPFFTDKLPNNWIDVGFIHLLFPDAKIIDARRDPMSCGFSNFKQNFARGQEFSYDMRDIGAYIRDYRRLLDHYAAAIPSQILQVDYEDLIADPPGKIRQILHFLDLPFNETCIRFWQNDRAVRTASSEQVRQPIHADAVAQWKNYANWLGPLRDALGQLSDA